MFYSRSPHTAATAHPLPFDSFLYLLRLVVQLIFAGGLFITASGSTDIRAQTIVAPAIEQTQAAATRRYDIPAGPLNTVLTRFSTESGIFLVGANDLAQGKNSPGVQGSFSIQGALDVLLTGTGMETQRNAQGQHVLQPVANTVGTLPLMTVSTSADTLKQGTAEEGYRVSNISGIGLWGERSLRDTPYSISVVTSDLIENVNAQDMRQIFKMNPLIQEPSTNVTTGVPNATMRGFNATTPIYDGIPLAYSNGSAISQGLLNLSKEKHNNYGGYIYSDTRFSTFNIDHKLTLGYSSNYYEQLVRNDGWAYLNGTSTLALSQLKYIPEPDWGPMGNKSMNPSYADQYNNILMGDNIIINDQWSVMFGLNYSTAINCSS
ncbi:MULTISPECIES: STN domain-containing protein [Nitrosomonas]|uniref:STN domain-containing protein n=1 Tax=Nitrosomonas TaxID=914 RepID=UPI0000191D6C|nr:MULTISPECIES: TonB-dependent receptor plug domain-containing protein [Nitrosomonas]SDW38325.1 TonB-dependent Receptor Plug Domain [Nitrosomonas europaea]SET02044.1 TonB-dependent Receptor Plug Domain [Nitrosomonas europaea]SJZ51525.1 TonB-dependent Receptor Plug Domain [Nitrosomonas europaea]HBF24844.1 hypothetical protein [Nitrosomonas sp.]